MTPKKYKAILIEDGSTLMRHFPNVRTGKSLMENHKDYHVLKYGKDYKIVLDRDAMPDANEN